MGQINSAVDRGRSEREYRANVDQPLSNTTVTAPDSPPGSSNTQTSADRRSIRNSVIDFVRPKSSRNSAHNSEQGSSVSRRPWRFSVAGRTQRNDSQDLVSRDQSSFTGPSPETGSARIRSRGDPPPNNNASSHHDDETTSDSLPGTYTDSAQAASGKGKEKSSEVSTHATDDSTSPLPDSADSTDPSSQSTRSDPATLPSTSAAGSNVNSSSSPPTQPAPSVPQRSPSNHDSIRQFPPSGTLVVVQGVVRTDGPLALAQRDSPLATTPERPANDSTSAPDFDSLLQDRRSADNEISESPEVSSSSRSGNNGNGSGNFPQSRSDNSSSPSESMSGSGADVLGALLSIVSVATAATAASLLTSMGTSGPSVTVSSEPHSLSADSSGSDASDGSNVPSIARALASANPIAASVHAERDREREERERHRARSIWGGLRERVTSGRSRSSAGIGPHSLFNELVHAFNMSSSQDDRQSDSDASEGLEDLTPGSFERFLIDLQSDLRQALSPSHTTPSVAAGEHSDNHENEDSAFPGGQDEGTSHESEDVNQPSEVASSRHSEGTDTEERSSSDDPANFSSAAIDSRLADNVFDNESADGGVPALEPLFASDSDETESSPTQGGNRTSTSSQGTTGDARRNRVNWWRMYRFPPIISIRTRQQNVGEGSPQPSTATSTSATPEPILSSTAETSVDITPTVQGTTTLLEPAVLIPIIVVGLQSINSETNESSAGNSDSGETVQQADVSRLGNSPGTGAAQRARQTWTSRAARTLNRLGRRHNHAGPTAEARSTTGGDHTFLIYVFGGHYPPDHQILSSPDATDSFEALWELADFLGQVKPQVVTEEEIERSGLELFRAAALRGYVSSGRVASSCLDRCLICLDDYNSDDELRLLTCKHAFHKACVDRWLKTGRNNCPACRSEGVRATGNAL